MSPARVLSSSIEVEVINLQQLTSIENMKVNVSERREHGLLFRSIETEKISETGPSFLQIPSELAKATLGALQTKVFWKPATNCRNGSITIRSLGIILFYRLQTLLGSKVCDTLDALDKRRVKCWVSLQHFLFLFLTEFCLGFSIVLSVRHLRIR